jgi:hypothetical protein
MTTDAIEHARFQETAGQTALKPLQRQARGAQTLCGLTRIVAHCRSQRVNPNYLFEEHFIHYA